MDLSHEQKGMPWNFYLWSTIIGVTLVTLYKLHDAGLLW